MTIKRYLRLAVLALSMVLISVMAVVNWNLARAADPIPNAVYACLPPATPSATLWGVTETDPDRYYLIGVGDADRYQEQLIYLDAQATCRSLLPDDDRVLSHFLPLHLARELALQRFTRVLDEQGGRDAYQRQLTAYLTAAPDGINSEFPPEYIWALEQLGLKLPVDHYEVLP
ncbi:MAG: hypothetical protein ACTS2F_19365 [Thainema sp.]